MNRANRPQIVIVFALAIALLGVASDFFGVIGFAGITKDSFVEFLLGKWHLVLIAVLSTSLITALAFLLNSKRAARNQADALNAQIDAAQVQLKDSEESLRRISDEAATLKTELDDHTGQLRETFAKYQDLTERCDAIVIQFGAVVDEFVGSGFFIKYTSVSDSTEARAIINALTNPIRTKLVNFQELTKRALAETKVALQESERTSVSLGELKTQLSTVLVEKHTAVSELLAKRAKLDAELREAILTVDFLRSELRLSLDRQEGLKTMLRRQEEQLRALEVAKTETGLAAHFVVRVEQLEAQIRTLADQLQDAEQENRLLAKENASLERLKLQRRR